MKTSTKRKAIMKEAGIPPKKRGRPVGSKTKKDKAWEAFWKTGTVMDMDDFMKTRDYLPHDEQEGIDVPDMTQWQKGFDEGTVCGYESASSDMKLVNKITLVLTLVNVAILGYLIVKNG